VQVLGKGSRTYTFTEIAAGTGLSLALVSKIFNGKLRITTYAAERLAGFLGITVEQLTPETIVVATPPARPLGRAVGRRRRNSPYRPPVLDRHASPRSVGPQESEPSPQQVEDFDGWAPTALAGKK
jgi:transcriptional regulator with XRE-family HTH domain